MKWNEMNEMKWNEWMKEMNRNENDMKWNEWNALNDWSEWNEWTNGRTDWLNECMHAWMNERMNHWINAMTRNEMKLHEWNEIKRNEIEMIWDENEHDMNESVKWQLDLPTLVWDRQFFFFYVKSSSRYSLACTFCQPHLPKKCPIMFFFCGFCVTSWSFNSPVLCQQLLPIEVRTHGSRDPPSATTEATLPEKTQAFASESLFKPEFTLSRPVTLPKYLMLMMMMMLMMMIMMKLVWWWWWWWW